jgi:hypothetical protein
VAAIRAERDTLVWGGAMSGGFAGSQRVDERRRRRLATVEEPSVTAGRSQPADRPLRDESPNPTSDLSLAGLVPTSWWRHLVLCLTGFVATAGVLTASIHTEELSRSLGVNLTRLLAAETGSVRGWWITISLLFQAQLALVIFWVRSQSLRDFDGRYHLWTRVAAAALLWSFCSSTSAHVLAGELLSRALGGTLGLSGSAGWILPGAGLAAFLVWSLHREMAACRGSDLALWLAGVTGAIYAVVALNRTILPGSWNAARGLILDGLTMSGIWLVCISFLIHARYVIHLSAEPVPVRRWTFRLPRPHWGRLGWRRSALTDSVSHDDSVAIGEKDGQADDVESSSTGRRAARGKPTRTRKPVSTPETDSSRVVGETDGSGDASTVDTSRPVSRSKLRLDAIAVTPSDLLSKDADRTVAEPSRPTSPKIEPTGLRQSVREEEVDGDEEEDSTPAWGSQGRSPLHSIERDSAGANSSRRFDTPPDDDRVETDEDDADAAGDEVDSADLSGLSKKQRRKLLAQQRERDRTSKRR